MSTGRSLVIPDDVVFEVLGEEAVLLNLRTGVYFRLNETGTRIWQVIEERGEAAAAADAVAREFEVDAEVARRDVDALVRELEKQQLLESRPA